VEEVSEVKRLDLVDERPNSNEVWMAMATETATAKMTIFAVQRDFWKRKSVFLILSTELYSLQTKFLPGPGKKRKQSRKKKKNFQTPKR
jgi:hypothetical protein